MEGTNLLVDGVDANHEFLCNLGLLRCLYGLCFHISIDHVVHKKFYQALHRIQKLVIFFGIFSVDLFEFLSKDFFKKLLSNLVRHWASNIFLKVFWVRNDKYSIFGLNVLLILRLINLVIFSKLICIRFDTLTVTTITIRLRFPNLIAIFFKRLLFIDNVVIFTLVSTRLQFARNYNIPICFLWVDGRRRLHASHTWFFNRSKII